MQVTGCAADSLDQRALGTQEAFLVRIKDRDQRHLGHIESLAQQVDADEHVEGTEPQIANDLRSFDGADVRMQIPDANAVFREVVRQVLGHSFCKRRDQHAFVCGRAPSYFGQHIVDLCPCRSHLDLRIDEPCRAHQLFDGIVGPLGLVIARRRRHIYGLRRQRFEFIETQRPVVERGRQAESVFDQRFLARAIATIHAAELRYRDVTFVDDQDRVMRHVIEQARRRFTFPAARQIARVILDPGAVTEFPNHLQIE